jgi:hypothetical protein
MQPPAPVVRHDSVQSESRRGDLPEDDITRKRAAD